MPKRVFTGGPDGTVYRPGEGDNIERQTPKAALKPLKVRFLKGAVILDGVDRVDECLARGIATEVKEWSGKRAAFFQPIGQVSHVRELKRRVEAEGIDTRPFTERELHEAAKIFLTHNNSGPFLKFVSIAKRRNMTHADVVEPVDHTDVTSGSIEMISQVVTRLRDERDPLLMTMHLAVDPIANAVMRDDAGHQSYLIANVTPEYLPTFYAATDIGLKPGRSVGVYANEWLTGFHEAHLREDQNGTNFIIWNRQGENLNLNEDQSRIFARDIYKVMTVYNEIVPETINVNSGDFVIRPNADGSFDAKMITVKNIQDPWFTLVDNEGVLTPYANFAGGREHLAKLLAYRTCDYESHGRDQRNAERGRPGSIEEGVFEWIKFADYPTILEGFHRGLVERMIVQGLGSQAQFTAQGVTQTLLESFLEKLEEHHEIPLIHRTVTDVTSIQNQHILEEREAIATAVDAYLNGGLERTTREFNPTIQPRTQ